LVGGELGDGKAADVKTGFLEITCAEQKYTAMMMMMMMMMIIMITEVMM
jgi:hypothetical protein